MDLALARARLVSQGLVTRPFGRSADAVAAFGAMQGQDLPGAISSVALRTTDGDAADVFAAFDAGDVVRGYPMRGTVFLTPAADLAWMTDLMAAPALRASERRRPQLGLTNDDLATATKLATTALDTPLGLPRADLFDTWSAAGIATASGGGYHLLSALIHTGDACYGPWNGADQNVVLAKRWLPAGTDLAGAFNGERVDAVAELLRRYLHSHGPATLRDFAWWTKLPLKEIRAALPMIRDDLEASDDDEPRYFRPGLPDDVAALGKRPEAPLLLPGFDEYMLGYADRTFAMPAEDEQKLVPGNNGMFKRSVVVKGQVVGTWTRAGRPGKRTFEVTPFDKIPATTARALAKQFDAFPFPAA